MSDTNERTPLQIVKAACPNVDHRVICAVLSDASDNVDITDDTAMADYAIQIIKAHVE